MNCETPTPNPQPPLVISSSDITYSRVMTINDFICIHHTDKEREQIVHCPICAINQATEKLTKENEELKRLNGTLCEERKLFIRDVESLTTRIKELEIRVKELEVLPILK